MKIARREFKYDEQPGCVGYWVFCPACESSHRFLVEFPPDPAQVWTFDGNEESPTFSPSLLVEQRRWRESEQRWIDNRCHSYLEAGVWRFLNDSTHAMAGQKVPMVEFPENYRV